jgi:hypothetical protein
MVTRIVTHSLFPKQKVSHQEMACPHCKQALSVPIESTSELPVTWIVGEPHPLVSSHRVVRMFIEGSAVEIYSHDGVAGMRNTIPMSFVRIVEEGMPLEEFRAQLTVAEQAADAEDEEESEEEEGEESDPDRSQGAPAAIPINGQPST